MIYVLDMMSFMDYIKNLKSFILITVIISISAYLLKYADNFLLVQIIISLLTTIPFIFMSNFFNETYKFEHDSGKNDRKIIIPSIILEYTSIIYAFLMPIILFTVVFSNSSFNIFTYLYLFSIFLIIFTFFSLYYFIKYFIFFLEYHIKENFDLKKYMKIKPLFMFSTYIFFFSLIILFILFIMANPHISIYFKSIMDDAFSLYILLFTISSLSIYYILNYINNG